MRAPSAGVPSQISAPAAAGAWAFLGPQPEVREQYLGSSPPTVYGNDGGRVTSLVVDPTSNGATAFAGTAGGGVWKTTDSGANWVPLTDGQISLAIGALAIDATGKVLYAGTGEANGSDSQYGQGILKSADGGTTWSLIGQSALGGIHIGDIAIDRTTSGSTEHVFAATDLGLFVSTDGGATWAQNTNILAATFPVPGFAPSGGITRIVQDLTDASKFWASLSENGAGIVPICATEEGNIAASTDGGSTWSSVNNFTTVPQQLSRIGLGIGPGGVAYVAAADCSGGLADIQTTSDGGSTWTSLGSSPGYSNYFNSNSTAPGGQGAYDNFVAVDPTNAAHVIFGGVTVLATRDGGASFADVGKVYSSGFIHPDFHAGAFYAADSLYVGNDGGVWKTSNLGGTGSSSDWSNLNATLAAMQFYSGAAIDITHILGGAQDNGTLGNFAGSGGPALPAWQAYFQGDGGYTAIDPNSTTIYAEAPSALPNGHPTTAMVRGQTPVNAADPLSPNDSFNLAGPCDFSSTTPACNDNTSFITPFVMDSTNSQHLIAGTYRVWLTTNGGVPAGPSSWTAISPDLTTGGGDMLTALTLVPGTNTVFTGSRLGAVAMTTDGSTWTTITGNLPVPFADPFPLNWVNQIAYNPTNTSELWLVIGGSGVGRVWHTTNAGAPGGTTWTDISGSGTTAVYTAPAVAVAADPNNPGTVYVGTLYGVQKCTTCGGTSPVPSWSDTLLPHVEVSQLTLTRDNASLIAWTHGRGAWALGLTTPPTSVP